MNTCSTKLSSLLLSVFWRLFSWPSVLTTYLGDLHRRQFRRELLLLISFFLVFSGIFLFAPSLAEARFLMASNDNGNLRLSLGDGASFNYMLWVSDFDAEHGGRGGNDYVASTYFDVGDPKIPFGSNIEAIITWQQIDGSCSSPHYTGHIDSDFACAISYANANNIPMIKYSNSSTSVATTTEIKNNPVIIVPGILGSFEQNNKWIIDPILHTYDNLVNTFLANGYVLGSTLFTFPYDWQKSIPDTAVIFKQKIDEVKKLCSCSKVDIVAHSMGGLVAKSYAQSNDYADDIGTLIFLATPHRGTPAAYLALEGGEFGNMFHDYVFKFIMDLYAEHRGFLDVFDYVNKYPVSSLSEILPIYSYLLNASTSKMKAYNDFDDKEYPRNKFLEDLSDNPDFLINRDISLFNIVGMGDSDSTVYSMSVTEQKDKNSQKWTHGVPVDIQYNFGDGVVTAFGAFIHGFFGYYADTVLNQADHRNMPTLAEDIVLRDIINREASTTVNMSTIENILIAVMHSPAEMTLVSPDGHSVGMDFVNDHEINDIPGAFYSGSQNEIQFITIPNPVNGKYKIKTNGKGSGNYTIEVNDFSDSASTTSLYTATTSPGVTSELEFDLNSSLPIQITETSRNIPYISEQITKSASISPNAGGQLRHVVSEIPNDIDMSKNTELQLDFGATEDKNKTDMSDLNVNQHIIKEAILSFVPDVASSTELKSKTFFHHIRDFLFSLFVSLNK